MEEVRDILQETFNIERWSISRPKDGQQKNCYVAETPGLKVFIKFGVQVSPLQRLAAIGVAPRILGSGKNKGNHFVIQEYLDAIYPDWHWFSTHLPLLASTVKCYHSDQTLSQLLANHQVTDFTEHVTRDLTELKRQYTVLQSEGLIERAIGPAFDKLYEQAQQLQSVSLVPVHPDPNTKNLLLVKNRLLMVDWDGVLLSDPMRDIGLLLWWYLPQPSWSEFFELYGLELDEAVTSRIFWWAARTSFAITLWHIEHHDNYQPFLVDFLATLNGQGNPHAVFKA